MKWRKGSKLLGPGECFGWAWVWEAENGSPGSLSGNEELTAGEKADKQNDHL